MKVVSWIVGVMRGQALSMEAMQVAAVEGMLVQIEVVNKVVKEEVNEDVKEEVDIVSS